MGWISLYIDDTMVMASGTFRGAVESAVRLLTEFIVLGFIVNLNHKTTIIPTTYYLDLEHQFSRIFKSTFSTMY